MRNYEEKPCVICGNIVDVDGSYSKNGENWTCIWCAKHKAKELGISECEYVTQYVHESRNNDSMLY